MGEVDGLRGVLGVVLGGGEGVAQLLLLLLAFVGGE